MNSPLSLSDSQQPTAFKKQVQKNIAMELLRIALKNWYWFALSVTVCLVMGKVYLRYQVPIYNVQARFLVKQTPSSGNADPMAQLELANPNNDVVNDLEILRTRLLMIRTVRELQANVSYYMKGRFKSTELYDDAPFIFKMISISDSALTGSWDVQIDADGKGVGLEDDHMKRSLHWGDTLNLGDRSLVIIRRDSSAPIPASANYLVVISPEAQVVTSYMNRLKVAQAGDGENVIQMSISDPIPKRGEDILNKLYDVYTRANVEDQNTTADNTIEFINNRLEMVHKELSGVEKNIEDFKSSNKIINVEDQAKQVLGKSEETSTEIGKIDLQLQLLESVQVRLKEKMTRVVPPDLLSNEPSYTSMAQKFNTLVLQRDAALGTTQPGNPIILQMNAQIDTVKTEMLMSLENIKRDLLLAKSGQETKLNELTGEIRSAPGKERTFLDISREQTVKQQLYLFLLQKREETAISKSGTLANSRLIEPAKSEGAPFSPNNMNIYMECLVLGMLIPSGIIYLREILNNKVRSKNDIEIQSDIPILGEIGHSRNDEGLVVVNEPRSKVAEEFRYIRTNLRYLLASKKHQVILITSSMGGEGKSFISLNLASALAQSGKKVALLELDLRKPRLSTQLGLPNDQGFTNYIISNTELKSLPKPVPGNPNLYIIGSGPIPPNPSELLMQDKIKTLFEYLYDNFDYIVIDSPPVGLVSDALLVAEYVDVCIYVARQNYTFKEQINIANDLFVNRKMKSVSIIVNDVTTKGAYNYGYGYGYGQNTYYSEDETKIKKLS
jgi:tyrosine-protein kinase Etk/Wzc